MVLKVNGFALFPTQRIADVLRDGDEVTVLRSCDKRAATLQPDTTDLAGRSPSKASRRQIYHMRPTLKNELFRGGTLFLLISICSIICYVFLFMLESAWKKSNKFMELRN